MARISGVDLPNKHVNIALTYVYGIGRSSANKICEETKVDPNVLINDLSEDDLTKLRKYIDENIKTEGRLRSEIGLNIKRLIDIGSYRGQRTRTNSRTRKGRKKTVANKKKA